MLRIVTLPTPTLRQRSREVERKFLLLPETQNFIDAMIPIMYAADGIGL
ncbi:MAG: peptide deformylase, partial [Candidatus Magasanikbacteria bacterium]|nr:peptide deformylase [Candidatus Magasanikbacteria bacterium]